MRGSPKKTPTAVTTWVVRGRRSVFSVCKDEDTARLVPGARSIQGHCLLVTGLVPWPVLEEEVLEPGVALARACGEPCRAARQDCGSRRVSQREGQSGTQESIDRVSWVEKRSGVQ